MIDRAFEDRLINWGSCYHYSKRYRQRSSTAVICERLAIAAGKQPRDGYRELYPRPELDEADGQIIEWCWARAAYRMDSRLRGLLKAHYVEREDKRKTCRALYITFRRYDSTLEEAVRKFKECVDLFENMSDNSSQIVRIPAQAV